MVCLQNALHYRGYMRILVGFICLAAASCGGDNPKSPLVSKDEEASHADKSEATGPFGIHMGQPLDSLQTEATDRPELFNLAAIPKPHPDIEEVAVVGFPKTGVCVVKGIGYTQENDQTGASVRPIADRLADQLTLKYGKPSKFDKCGGYFCDSVGWSMDVMNGERIYGYSWTGTKAKPLPENVKELAVGVATTNLAQPYVVVEYIFDNEASCKATGDRVGSSSL